MVCCCAVEGRCFVRGISEDEHLFRYVKLYLSYGKCSINAIYMNSCFANIITSIL